MEYRRWWPYRCGKDKTGTSATDEILICLPPSQPSSGILNRRAMVELAVTNSGGK